MGVIRCEMKVFRSVKVNSGIKLLGSISIFKLSKSYKIDAGGLTSYCFCRSYNSTEIVLKIFTGCCEFDK